MKQKSTAGRCFLLAPAAALCGLCLAGCRQDPQHDRQREQFASSPPAQTARLAVLVSILPQAYFVERVGGERVWVQVLIGPGQNPHAYEPTPAQLRELASARVFFCIGLPFEQAILPRLRDLFGQLEVVDTRAGIVLRQVECRHSAHAHEHHDHADFDPHIWLSPRLVKIQARTIADTLARLDPSRAEQYRLNLAAFEADLDALDARVAEMLAPVRGRQMFVFHPAFGYFADEYGLEQVAVEVEGKEPSAKELAALIERARQVGARAIFVQPQFSTRSAEALARQIGAAVLPLDDLPRDYLAGMEALAAQVRRGLLGE